MRLVGRGRAEPGTGADAQKRPLLRRSHFWARLYGMTGQREQARTALSTAMEMYRAMEMTFWLPETEATLAQMEAQ